MSIQKRTRANVAEGLSHRGGNTVFFLGAGCSYTAGIPLASGIIADIRKKFPHAYASALESTNQQRFRENKPELSALTYGECMAALAPGTVRDLFRGYIDKAKINWAHVGIGALVKASKVGRILTTNFDPLIARGCALFNAFPAVYDLTMTAISGFESLPDQAVFHLHGQRNGFRLLNEPDRLADHRNNLRPLFKALRGEYTWVVCGYSGENDPLFELLSDVAEYPYDLFWVGRDAEPPGHLSPLFEPGKRCFYVHDDGADEFFVRLAASFGLMPPAFMGQPADFLEELLGQLTAFPVGKADDLKIDLLAEARGRIATVRSALTPPIEASTAQATAEALAFQGEDAARALADKAAVEPSPSYLLAVLAFMEGNRYVERARSLQGNEARERLESAARLYERALEIKPDSHEALNNWGNALNELARLSKGRESRRLLQLAFSKYDAALKLKPDYFKALSNWGHALDDLAKHSERDEARSLLELACGKYREALKIKPDYVDAVINLGAALGQLADLTDDIDDANSLLTDAMKRFEAALRLKPDLPEALSSWGNALDRVALLSRNSFEEDRKRLWERAFGKFDAALKIKPDFHDALCNWGAALLHFAAQSPVAEHEALLVQAEEKLLRAEAIKPGSGAYNLACVAARRNHVGDALRWLVISSEHGTLPTRQHIAEDADLDAIRADRAFVAWFDTLENSLEK